MPDVKLCQIVAVEKSAKSKTETTLTAQYHLIQKDVLLQGLVRTYSPKDSEGELLPGEKKEVQVKLDDVIGDVSEALADFFDVIATKDWGNTKAAADVKLADGTVLLYAVPVTYLLFLEKQLVNIRTFISKLPTLDPAENWIYDPISASFKSEETETTRSKKVPKAHVLYEATLEHPAQVETYHEDVVVGTWKLIKFSGALEAQRVRELMERVEELQKAVKFAREEANSTIVEHIQVGDTVMGYLFA